MTLAQFEHTHLGAYLVGAFAVSCLFTDSAQGLIERNRLNRKWLLLYGVLCIFAYLYARPFIRVGLGSAKRGYINFSALYIVWLCSAVFYHLPSLEQLGLDIRADVSMLIVAFMSSLAALSLLAGLHKAAVSLRLLPRRAYLPAIASARSGVSPGSGARGPAGYADSGLRELWILLLLNSMIIAVACSTYYSFCGNGTLVVGEGTPAFKVAVCAKWLHPILTADYPRFASWMLYGEGSAYTLAGGGAADAGAAADGGSSSTSVPQNGASGPAGFIFGSGYGNDTHGSAGGDGDGDGSSSGYISVDFPFDGDGMQSVPAGDVLSPVLCMWVTLVALYIATTLAGHPRLVQTAAMEMLPRTSTTGININQKRSKSSSAKIGGTGAGGGGASERGRRGGSRSETRSPPSASPSSSSLSGRRTASFRRAAPGGEGQGVGGTATGQAGAAGTAGAAATAAAGPTVAAGGSDGIRKSRHPSLDIKKPITKGLRKAAAAAASAARGVAASAALLAAGSAASGAAAAAARRSLSSLHGLAASTGRLKRAASDYLNTSHPYLPALLGQVRRSMAALEPHHLAAELAEATGLAPDLARALTRGSSFSALADAAAATLSSPLSPAVSFLNLGPASITAGAGRNAASVSGAPGARLSSYYTSIDAGAGGGGGGGRAAGGGGFLGVGAVSAAPTAVGPPPQPEFRDMVPWYSGTSADLFKTLFDLMVSVKLFLGRFDMRTMQAATAASMADSFNDTPNEGDGFTYEHLEERQQLWIDFIADTGDGGNPTYAVAAALAAPALTVAVSEDLPRTPPSAAAGEDGGNKNAGGRGRTAAEGGVPSPPRPGGSLVLPRGDVLLVGGDLAYPNPSRETYQQRLFTPFSYALPPPPHFHPGRLVVHKPDLPPAWGVQEAHLPCDLRGLSPRSSRRASSAALRRYMGPTAFAIPGNHDWIDGLETFTREIQHKGWLGGWLLPQEKSYFALRLPAGWWLFGFDLALVQDIDMQQYRYFANVVEQRMGPDDQVILMTHEPLWLLEWFWQRRHGTNLRQLVRGHLRGRARLHLAGDLHFYMRHTWNAAAPLEAEPPAPAPVLHGRGYSARGDADASVPEQAGSDDGSLCGLSSATASEDLQQLRGAAPIQPRAPAVAPPAADPASNTGGSSDRLLAGGSSDEALSGFSATASTSSLERSFNLRGNAPNPHSRPMQQQQAAAAPAGPGSRSNNDPALQGGSPAAPRSSQAPPLAHSKTQRRTEQQTAQSLPQPLRLNTSDPGMAETDGGGFAVRLTCLPSHARCAACEARQRWIRHPHDPQHLIVNGGGGAFLHPTHVFAGARFPAAHDPAADATAGLYAEVALPCTCGIYSPGTALYGGAPGGRIGPWLASGGWPLRPLGQPGGGGGTSTSSMTSFKDASRSVPAAMRASSCGAGGDSGISGFAAKGPEGEYLCAACYPSPRTSMHLGRRNLHVFRLRNTRFDVIGGVFYFLLVVSVLPRCSHLAEVLEADTPAKALSLLFTAYVDTLGAILGRSYLSAGALALLFLFTLGLAKGGGVGVTRSPLPSSSATSNGISIADGGAAMATTPSASPGTDSGVSSVCAPRPLLTARMGGFGGQLAFATAHCLTHVSLAIVLLLLLELGVETCIKFERLGADGPHSLYRWYRAYEEQHFPDPMGLRQSLQRWTMGLYPGVLQLAMSVYDVPELIAVARTAMCEAGGSLEPITRLQAVSYYAGMLSYYWLLATPAVGFVFGLYLYLSVCWCHVHYDEAFSSLREANCKSFCRLHIGPSGDLQLYTLALDEVPTRWQEDPRWWGPNGGGSPSVMAHEAHYPSRWVPVGSEVGQKQDGGAAAQRASATSVSARGGAAAAAAAAAVGTAPSTKWRLVDYVFVPRKQP